LPSSSLTGLVERRDTFPPERGWGKADIGTQDIPDLEQSQLIEKTTPCEKSIAEREILQGLSQTRLKSR
jgi:hypothetical protein